MGIFDEIKKRIKGNKKTDSTQVVDETNTTESTNTLHTENVEQQVQKPNGSQIDMRDVPNEVLVYTMMKTLEKDHFFELFSTKPFKLIHAIGKIYNQTYNNDELKAKKDELEQTLIKMKIGDYYDDKHKTFESALSAYKQARQVIEDKIKGLFSISEDFCKEFIKELNSNQTKDIIEKLRANQVIYFRYDDNTNSIVRSNHKHENCPLIGKHEYWLSRDNLMVIGEDKNYDYLVAKSLYNKECENLFIDELGRVHKYSEDTFDYNIPEKVRKYPTTENLKYFPNEILTLAFYKDNNYDDESEFFRHLNKQYVEDNNKVLRELKIKLNELKIEDFMKNDNSLQSATKIYDAKVYDLCKDIKECEEFIEIHKDFLSTIKQYCEPGNNYTFNSLRENRMVSHDTVSNAAMIVVKDNVIALRRPSSPCEHTTLLNPEISRKMDRILERENPVKSTEDPTK